MALYLVFITLFTFFLLYIFREKSRLPPGPWNVPILGSLFRLHPQNPHISLAKLAQKFGPIFSMKLGTISTVVVSDATILKRLLTKKECAGRAPMFLLDIVTNGKGILFTQGDFWSKQRKFVVDFLRESRADGKITSRRIVQETIKESARDLVQSIHENGNILELLDHSVASVVSVLFMGKSYQRYDQTWQKLIRLIHEGSGLIELAAPLNFLPFLRFLPRFKKLLGLLLESQNALKDTAKKIINESKPFGFMETFLERTKYDEDQLGALIVDLFAASLNTTTTSLYWIFLYLAAHRNVQEKVREEVLKVLQGKSFELEDLESLPYTNATISEIMRIRTVVPLGHPQCALKDVELDEFLIPKGTMIMPLLWLIHMDPKTWERPEEFRPERFLNPAGTFYRPEQFLPFQTGKRTCVGEELANMMIVLFVATVLTSFEIQGKKGKTIDLEGVCGLTLAPKRQDLVFVKI